MWIAARFRSSILPSYRCFATSRHNKTHSRIWYLRQSKDIFVKQAAAAGYRSRSAYKLIQIDEKFHIFSPEVSSVLDLGAAPGSWSQVARQRCANAKIVAVDLRPFEPISDVETLFDCDISSSDALNNIRGCFADSVADVVLSDIAPNASPVAETRHYQIVKLALHAFNIALTLQANTFVCKLWLGAESQRLRNAFYERYVAVNTFKPGSSRPESDEYYLVCRRLRREHDFDSG